MRTGIRFDFPFKNHSSKGVVIYDFDRNNIFPLLQERFQINGGCHRPAENTIHFLPIEREDRFVVSTDAEPCIFNVTGYLDKFEVDSEMPRIVVEFIEQEVPAKCRKQPGKSSKR